mmetsp:Transcript_22594/g.33037  ORF Transcript_22594/g.33037 Transcript_22594/m.33037 type:complete len:180 (+) Transcript_22594:52-591(+)
MLVSLKKLPRPPYSYVYRHMCLTHVDASNNPTMVDVSGKLVTSRRAHARCFVELPDTVLQEFQCDVNRLVSKKGPVISTAIIAGVTAAKKTSDLIPFCHHVAMDSCKIKIDFDCERKNTLRIDCIAVTEAKTGVEMEAFVGATNAALCVYDMCKAVSHDIRITDVHLVSKTGGKRDYIR